MGTTVAGNPYLIQAAEYITPGLPYFAAIGIDDEDRHIRERVQTACETVGYAWPEGRTTLALMPTNQPKRPGLCALSAAVCNTDFPVRIRLMFYRLYHISKILWNRSVYRNNYGKLWHIVKFNFTLFFQFLL